MTEKEKMLSGELYYSPDEELVKLRETAHAVTRRFNSGPEEGDCSLLRGLFGKCGENFHVEPTFRCDYGFNIEVGENFYANYDCILLDVCKIKIGDNCMLAPRVCLMTGTHPTEAAVRITDIEYGAPITLGNNVWIGCGAIVNPGVTIGDNVVIASGAVVIKDLPDNVVAAGCPAVVVKHLPEEKTKQE